jgi:hypothetical protein
MSRKADGIDMTAVVVVTGANPVSVKDVATYVAGSQPPAAQRRSSENGETRDYDVNRQ